jgi:hypothetical protein
MSSRKKYDAFICHASEDKIKVATPLAELLENCGLKVWYDKFTLHVGDNVSQKIDEGLTSSKHGIIILSKNFFNKKKRWPKKELSALMNRHVNSSRRIILPIRDDISTEEIRKYSAQLADIQALKTDDGIDKVAEELCREIKSIRTNYDFKSSAKLGLAISKLSSSIQGAKLQVKENEQEMQLIILTEIYLIAKGYRMAYISYHQLSVSLSSNKELTTRTIRECIKVLIRKKLIESKSLGTVSITHKGIKEIEWLLEESSKKSLSSRKKAIASRIKHSVREREKTEIRDIQRLRYDILERAFHLAEEGNDVVNIFKIANSQGMDTKKEHEKLERVYFYLQGEGLIESHAIGGSFRITAKGQQRVSESRDRIF